ncbi:MAG: hypothetical protein AB7T27_10690 [Kiritimatiellia bacterium]
MITFIVVCDVILFYTLFIYPAVLFYSPAVALSRRILSIPEEPVWGSMASRQWDTSCWVADSRKIQREPGWSVRNTFEQGFRQMVQWFVDNPSLRAFYQSA